jgi:hypothetical protein
MSQSSDSTKQFHSGDIVIKRYIGFQDKTFLILDNAKDAGYYNCFSFEDSAYIEIFLGYHKKSRAVKKVA